jgi:hypothetical protein
MTVGPDILATVTTEWREAEVDSSPLAPLHTHRNPITGVIVGRTWPCPQCVALGRTEPLRYVSDGGTVPDDTGLRATEIPPERLEAFLASFSAPEIDAEAGD